MKCADIMNKNLECLSEEDTVAKAASVMAEAGVGFLPICDARRHVIGVVTDRDLVTRALAKNVAPEETPAARVMTFPVVTCLETADIRDAERLMVAERKARLVITDGAGRLSGVLSLADLIEQAPAKESLRTAQAILWRESLGPRAGAYRGDPMLKNDPDVGAEVPPGDAETVFTGGNHDVSGTKFFP